MQIKIDVKQIIEASKIINKASTVPIKQAIYNLSFKKINKDK